MTGTELKNLIHVKCNTNTTSFTDADMLVLANLMKDEIAAKIAAAKNEAFNVEELDDLVGDQRLYPYKQEVMNNLVRLEIKFTSTGDYKLAIPAQLAQTRIVMQESIIITYYDNEDPRYFIRGKHIYILSDTIIAVTSGIKWVYKIFPADLANLTGSAELSLDTSATSLGFPKEFHELWARRVGIEKKSADTRPLTKKELQYDKDLAEAIGNFAVPNIDEELVGILPSSVTRGNDGQDF